jgi:penicillin G amidase
MLSGAGLHTTHWTYVRLMAVTLAFGLGLSACGDDDDDDTGPGGGTDTDTTGGTTGTGTTGDTTDTTPTDTTTTDTGTGTETGDTSETETTGTETETTGTEDPNVTVINANSITGAPVEIKFDEWGVPHIYAENEKDLYFANGYVMARHRMFQMAFFRALSEGSFSELLGPDSILSGVSALTADANLRVWQRRRAAQALYDSLPANDPTRVALDSFSAGVNFFLDNAKWIETGVEFVGLNIQPNQIRRWTGVDSLSFARYQTYDLSNGYISEPDLAEQVLSAQGAYGESPRAGLEEDLLTFQPAGQFSTLDGAETPTGRKATGFKATAATGAKSGARRLYANVRGGGAQKLVRDAAFVYNLSRDISARFFGGDTASHGSNNWIISPGLTKSGHAILANDTHLSMTVPSVWFELHLNTKKAGGDLNVVGTGFAPTPSVVLGHNETGAWGATVNANDVIDWYVDAITARDAKGFVQKVSAGDGAKTLQSLPETFKFRKAEDTVGLKSCEKTAQDNFTGTLSTIHPYTVQDLGNDQCSLTVNYLAVPGAGIIQSVGEQTTVNGEVFTDAVISARWTGYEPSNELEAFYKMAKSTDATTFQAAAESFKVGGQNFVYANTNGDIYYTTQLYIPTRPEAALSDETPPWFPYPGSAGREWIGRVPNEDIPKVLNPFKGYLVTANNDVDFATRAPNPLQYYRDTNEPYRAFFHTDGYRAKSIVEDIEKLIDRDGEAGITLEESIAVQQSGKSSILEDYVPLLQDTLAYLDQLATPTPSAFAPTTALAPQGDYDAKALWEANKASLADALGYLDTFSDPTSPIAYIGYAGLDVGAGAPPQAEIDNSIAMTIGSVWMNYFFVNTLGDELDTIGIGLGDTQVAKAMARIALREELTSGRGGDGHSILFDDDTTIQIQETRAYIVVKSLVDALAWITSQGGKPEGFPSTAITDWRWGHIHTLTLEQIAGQTNFNVPPPGDTKYPKGLPRNGDGSSANVANYGYFDRSFGGDFKQGSGGPAIKMNVELKPGQIKMFNTIPGGQMDAVKSAPNVNDQIYQLWIQNKVHQVWFYDDEVEANTVRRWILKKGS